MNSPTIPPIGLEAANNKRKTDFFKKLELMLFKKIINTAAISNLWIRIVDRYMAEKSYRYW